MFFPAPQCFLFYRCQFWRSPAGGDVAPILDSSSSCSRMFEAFFPLIGDFKQPCRNDSLWLPLLFSLGLESDILSHDGGDKAAQGRTEGMDCVWGCVFFFLIYNVWPFSAHVPPTPASGAISTCKTATWSRLMKWQQNCLPWTNRNWTFASVMVTWKKVKLQGHTPWPPLEFS